jgi:hypothetical protein
MGVIGGTVVDDQEFEVGKGLPNCGLERVFQVTRGIERGRNDAHHGRLLRVMKTRAHLQGRGSKG